MIARRAALLFLFFPAAVLAAVGAETAPPKPDPASPPGPSTAAFSWRTEANTAFSPGESLLFVIKYGFVSGGHATLEVRSTETVHGRDAWHIVSESRTNDALDVVFKVRDLNETWMDSASLCSHKYHQVTNEGRYHREAETRFDHENGTFAYWKRGKKSQDTVQGTTPPFVHDILTSLYYVRTRPLTPGQDLLLDVNSGGKNWPLRVEVKGIEKIKVPAGKFECIHVRPLLSGEGLFMQTGNLEVWLTNDERRLPVLLRSKVMVGSFTAELTEIDFHRAAPRDLLAE